MTRKEKKIYRIFLSFQNIIFIAITLLHILYNSANKKKKSLGYTHFTVIFSSLCLAQLFVLLFMYNSSKAFVVFFPLIFVTCHKLKKSQPFLFLLYCGPPLTIGPPPSLADWIHPSIHHTSIPSSTSLHMTTVILFYVHVPFVLLSEFAKKIYYCTKFRCHRQYQNPLEGERFIMQ